MTPHRIAIRNRERWFDATTRGLKMESFLHVPLLAYIGGGVISVLGGLLAQMSSNDTVAYTGLWASIAGVVATIGGVISVVVKAFFDEKQKQREHELAKLKQAEERERQSADREFARAKLAVEAENIRKSGMHNKLKIEAIKRWMHDAKANFPGLPDPPGFDVDTGDFLLVTPDPDHKTA